MGSDGQMGTMVIQEPEGLHCEFSKWCYGRHKVNMIVIRLRREARAGYIEQDMLWLRNRYRPVSPWRCFNGPAPVRGAQDAIEIF